jgi:pre-mRNA-splicing factor CWC26
LKSFQRAKKSGWQTKTPQGDQPLDDAAPSQASPTEDAPAAAPVTKKRGGLLTAAELREEAAALEARRAAEESARAAALAAADPSDDVAIDPRQTIYRDKSGAIIDVAAAERAERAARAEEVRKEKEKKEWGKGIVQRSAKEARVKKEQSMGKKDVARFVGFLQRYGLIANFCVSRYANDKDMNDELRAVERADDPAAAFLTVRTISQPRPLDKDLSLPFQKRKSKGPQRPKYTGPPAPPNRFNILPGYRWDGVGE